MGGLILNTGAVLDIANNGLVVDYEGASPMASIQSAIISAFSGGNWTGNGITTSYGNATQSAIGYGESSTLLGPSGGGFMGQNTDATAVLIRHTRYGDANLSGSVDGSDFNSWNIHRDTAGSWADADFNYDGLVNQADLDLWTANRFTTAASITPPPVVEAVATSQPNESASTASKNEKLAPGTVPAPVVRQPPVRQAAQQPQRQQQQQRTGTSQAQVQQRMQQLGTALSGYQRQAPELPAWFTLPAMDIALPQQNRLGGGYQRYFTAED